ncbi:MAG: NFACT family protein [Fusobacterium sp.]|uniref:Rqc2 family fibronectin-binding protein n=1 Tax=Fusobacterium sp. TaxID=68766 RepID=UPI0026DCA3EC|nr:NFACT family protein [Fusobacterium sp.]MDO4690234.1 NFACT family protein [Fusobacterium sp.]
MLYIDGISLNKIKNDLKNELLNKRINRIFKNNEHSISLHFGKMELLFSCLPQLTICYINQNKEKPILDIASSIISNLRKHLMNATLVNIEQLGFDRILVFIFTKINELGQLKKYYIYFECLAKSSNLIFCDEDHKIIDSLKKYSISEKNERTLFNGERYKRPQYEIKISPFDLGSKDFQKIITESSLTKKVEGLGSIFEKAAKDYITYRKLLENYDCKIYFQDKKIKLASVLALDLKDYTDFKEFKNFNDLINFYIHYESVSTNFNLLKNKLNLSIEKKLKKLKKILILIKKDIEDSQAMTKVKEEADILAANLYNLKKGMSSIKTYNFYHNIEVEIKLDPLLSPKENLDKYYKKYNKMKRGLENAQRRHIEVNNEINYLDSNLLFIQNSSTIDELRDIEEELIKQRYILPSYKTKKTKLKKEIKYGILEFKDSVILYGRNNLENDYLSFKVANKNDYWFHAKNIASSHVIVKTNTLSEELIKKAAELTAFYTKLNLGEKVEVDYTQRKYLNKPNGAKPGFVTYSNQKTILVEKKDLEIVKN